jgi:hypothetical protein
MKIERATYTNLNRLARRCMSSLTASLSFDGALNVGVREFKAELKAYERIHLPNCSCWGCSAYDEQMAMGEIGESMGRRAKMIVLCDPRDGKQRV